MFTTALYRLTLLSDNLSPRFRAISWRTEASSRPGLRAIRLKLQKLVNGLWRQQKTFTNKIFHMSFAIPIFVTDTRTTWRQRHFFFIVGCALRCLLIKRLLDFGIVCFISIAKTSLYNDTSDAGTQRHEIFIFPSFHLARRHETEVCWWTSVLMMINKLHLSELLSANGAENMPAERVGGKAL